MKYSEHLIQKCNRVNEQDVNVTGMRKVIFYILYLLEP